MTPTRAQYDAVLTRSSAGVRAATGDMDDPEDRAVFLDWLENLNRQAGLVWLDTGLPEPLPPEVAVDGVNEARIELVHDLHRAVHGDTWARPEPPVVVWHGLLEIVRQAVASVHVSDEQGSEGTHGPREPSDGHTGARFDPELYALLAEEEAIARGDRTAHMSARVVASNDWPSPAKGTHESDLWRDGVCELADLRFDEATEHNYHEARDWSRSA